MQHPSPGAAPRAHARRKWPRGIKFDRPSCPSPQGRQRPREPPRARVRAALRAQFPEAGTARFCRHTHRQPPPLGTPEPARGGGQGTTRTGLRAGAARKAGGRDRHRGRVSARFKSLPSPPRCPRSCGNIPAVAPPPRPLGFLRSPSLPGRRRRRLKGTAAPRCPATPGAAAS